jgi:hemerythrin-like domain-containing protein
MEPSGGRRRVVEFGRLDADLLADPLAFLGAEHARQRALLGHLERLARHPDGPGTRALAIALAEWLAEDLPRHIADEEGSLHARLAPFDTQGVLPALAADHEREARDGASLLSDLRAIIAHQPPPADFAARAQRFAEGYRAHLAIEDAAVTPLARRVLAPEVLAEIGAEMAARRR